MGDSTELWQRVHADEQATLHRIEAIEAQLASERRHLDEVRLFQAMLGGYDGAGQQAEPRPDSAGVVPAGDETTEAALSAAQAEELDRLNRLFGLNGGG